MAIRFHSSNRARSGGDGCACFAHLVRFLIWAGRNAHEQPSREPAHVIPLGRVPCS